MAKRVLLIDDDRDFVEINRLALKEAGYDVTAAFDGKEGLEKALEVNPDVIILDVMMTHETEGFFIAKLQRGHCSMRAYEEAGRWTT